MTVMAPPCILLALVLLAGLVVGDPPGTGVVEELALGREGEAGLAIRVEGSRVSFTLSNPAGPVLEGRLGVGLPALLGPPDTPGECPGGAGLCLRWPGVADLAVAQEGDCFTLSWKVEHLQLVEDCLGEPGPPHPRPRVRPVVRGAGGARPALPPLPQLLPGPGAPFLLFPARLQSIGLLLHPRTHAPLSVEHHEQKSNAFLLDYHRPGLVVQRTVCTLDY